MVAGLALAGCGGDDDGTPLGDRTVNLDLSYYSRSDYGPQDATGTAVIVTKTGQVDVTVQDLDMLDGEMYEGWLAGGGETPISTGKFNTDASGAGSSTIALGDITTNTYAFFLLTVEPEPDPTPDPDPRHSIGADIPSAE
jgi:hypothetical protein